MSFRGKMWTLLLSSVIAGYVLVGGLPFVGSMLQTTAQQPINDAGAQLRIFESVLQHIQNDYVDVPDLEKVRLGALRGLVGGLDPYSSYLTPEQVTAFRANGSSGKVGIGAEFSQVLQYLYVISVVKGGNAEKAGLKAGDVIEYIEGKATRDISLYDAKEMLLGDSGSEVTVRVLRSNTAPQTLKIKRGSYETPKVETRTEAGNIGVIKVYSLEKGEAEDIRKNVAELSSKGVSKLVLDLRGVSKGTLEEAAGVLNLFIKDGDLAKVIGRDGKVVENYTADPQKTIFNGEAAVLIDLGSAGAAEAVAAGFIERKRGEVIGERTFGAGTVQQLFQLKGGDGMLLTVARWASPEGKPFLGDTRETMGIKPSIEVKRPDTPAPVEVEELIEQQDPDNPTPTDDQPRVEEPKKEEPKAEDLQLKKAIEVLQGKAKSAGA